MGAVAGVAVKAYALDGEALGDVHVPPPVWIGDVLALRAGPPLEVVSVLRADERPVAVIVRCVYLHESDA